MKYLAVKLILLTFDTNNNKSFNLLNSLRLRILMNLTRTRATAISVCVRYLILFTIPPSKVDLCFLSICYVTLKKNFVSFIVLKLDFEKH